MPNQEETFDAREPPKLTLPSIPPDFVATSASDLRGHRPMKAEVAAAELAVQEVTAMTDSESLFGITAKIASLASPASLVPESYFRGEGGSTEEQEGTA